ncbi:MAG: GntR family transcriptional regulator [Chloroflexota bacterium]
MIRATSESAMPSVAPIEHTDLTEKVYELLREKIFAREFQPGVKLDLDRLAEGFRISRAPINSAIIRLASDGLVRIEPRRGTFIRELTARNVAETYEVRRALELRAAELGIQAASAEDIARLYEIIGQMAELRRRDESQYLEYVTLDRDFHLALVAIARNDKIIQIYQDLHTDVINARLYFHGMPREGQVVSAEHQAIVDAYAARDLKAATTAIIQAIEGGQRGSLQRIEELGGTI